MRVMMVVMKMEIGGVVIGLINSSSLCQSWPLDIQVTQVSGRYHSHKHWIEYYLRISSFTYKADILLAFYLISIFRCFAPKGAVLSAEGSYARGGRRKAPRLVQGVKMAGRWRISYSSTVMKNPGAALRRYGGLLDIFKSLIKELPFPPPTSTVMQWTWTHWLEDDYSSYLSFDNERQQYCGDVALPLESREEEEQSQYYNKDSKNNFNLANSIVKKLNRYGRKKIDDVDAIEAIELAVQWRAMTEGTLDESLNFTSLNPLTDRGCRWFTSARWRSWAEGPGSFSRGASAFLKVVYSLHNLELPNGVQQPEMRTDTYDVHVVADGTHDARLEALPEDWLDDMMKEVLDRESYPPDPRPYPLGPVSPHTPFGRSLWMWKYQNGSPVGRLFSRFSNHLARLVDAGGGVGVVSSSWERFMWEIRSLWEQRESIPGMLPLPIVDGVDMLDPQISGQEIGVQQCLRQMRSEKPVAKPDMDPVLYPPEPDPDLRLGSITQLLMLVNCCIGAVAVPVEGSPNTNDTKERIAVDDDDPFNDEYIKKEEEEDEKYFYDVSRDGDGVTLIPPKLSPLCPIVDHAGYRQTAVALHVMKSLLIADMEAFLRSNPKATCDDFCTWYGLWSRSDDDGEEWSSNSDVIIDDLGWNVEKKNVTFITKETRASAGGCHHGAPQRHETEGEKMRHSSQLAQKVVNVVGRYEFSMPPPPAASPNEHHGWSEQHEKVVSQAPAFQCIDVNLHQSCSHAVHCEGGGLDVVEGAPSTSFIPIATCWAEANKNRNSNSSRPNHAHCPIFSPSTEAEKALHLLETISPSNLCIEALSSFLASADFVLCMVAHELGLIESFSCVKESLCDLRQWMERRIDDDGGGGDDDASSNSNEYSKLIAESLAYGCELLTIAEGCVERAIAIRNSFPRIPPDVANNLARYPCTRHVELPSGPEGSSAVSKLGKVICGVNWERYIEERGGIPPPPSRREYILSCPASGLRPTGDRGSGTAGNGGIMTQARMHAIVLEPPSQALTNVTTNCQVRISTVIPEPEAMEVVL